MSKKFSEIQNNHKLLKITVIVLNVIGIICLIYFMIPYLKHDMSISNPKAMISSYSWDTSGFILMIGFIPLVIANVMAYIFIDIKSRVLRLLYFIPSLICLILVGHYLMIGTTMEEEKQKEAISTMKCVIDGKHYSYQIFKEDKVEFSLGMDENDKLPLSIVDYTSEDTIIKSIENYYKNNGGMCP